MGSFPSIKYAARKNTASTDNDMTALCLVRMTGSNQIAKQARPTIPPMRYIMS